MMKRVSYLLLTLLLTAAMVFPTVAAATEWQGPSDAGVGEETSENTGTNTASGGTEVGLLTAIGQYVTVLVQDDAGAALPGARVTMHAHRENATPADRGISAVSDHKGVAILRPVITGQDGQRENALAAAGGDFTVWGSSYYFYVELAGYVYNATAAVTDNSVPVKDGDGQIRVPAADDGTKTPAEKAHTVVLTMEKLAAGQESVRKDITVWDMPGGSVVEGALLELYYEYNGQNFLMRYFSDENGKLSFTQLCGVEYSYTLSKLPEHEMYPADGRELLDLDYPGGVIPAGQTGPIEQPLYLQPGGQQITFHVTNRDTGAAAEGVNVSVYAADKDGRKTGAVLETKKTNRLGEMGTSFDSYDPETLYYYEISDPSGVFATVNGTVKGAELNGGKRLVVLPPKATMITFTLTVCGYPDTPLNGVAALLRGDVMGLFPYERIDESVQLTMAPGERLTYQVSKEGYLGVGPLSYAVPRVSGEGLTVVLRKDAAEKEPSEKEPSPSGPVTPPVVEPVEPAEEPEVPPVVPVVPVEEPEAEPVRPPAPAVVVPSRPVSPPPSPENTIVLPGADGTEGTTDDRLLIPQTDEAGRGVYEDEGDKILLPFGGWMTFSTNPDIGNIQMSLPEGTVVEKEYGTITLPAGDQATTIVLPGNDEQLNTADDPVLVPALTEDGTNNAEIGEDGLVSLPDGGELVLPIVDGEGAIQVHLPASTKVRPDGTLVLEKGAEGLEIILPGPNNELGNEDDVVVIPKLDEDGINNVEIHSLADEDYPNGGVYLPDGGYVIIDGIELEVPKGTIVLSDGTIIYPEGSGEIAFRDCHRHPRIAWWLLPLFWMGYRLFVQRRRFKEME